MSHLQVPVDTTFLGDNIQPRTVVNNKKNFFQWHLPLGQQFSTSVNQEFFKNAIPDYVVRDTDLISFRLSNKKMTTANTITDIWCEWIKIIPMFLSDWQSTFFKCATEF